MLTMTCDRCGKIIEYDDQRKEGGGGRDRWRFQGHDIIVDLCTPCRSIVRHKWFDEIESWSTPKLDPNFVPIVVALGSNDE